MGVSYDEEEAQQFIFEAYREDYDRLSQVVEGGRRMFAIGNERWKGEDESQARRDEYPEIDPYGWTA